MKNIKTLSSLVWGLILTTWVAVPIRAAETDADDVKMQTEEQQIDKETATNQEKVETLAKEFKVPASTVQDLRNKGQGWGEITIGLSTAQQLSKTDPKTYPTLSAALSKVESLRNEGMGWGKIAKTLGFKLGPVIREARFARREMRETLERHEEKEERERRPDRDDRTPRPERSEKLERSERMEHSEQMEQSERMEHPEMGRSEHVGR